MNPEDLICELDEYLRGIPQNPSPPGIPQKPDVAYGIPSKPASPAPPALKGINKQNRKYKFSFY